MKKLIAATIVMFGFTTQALAWGDREQGILAGIAGTLILQNVIQNRQAQPYPPVYTNQQHYPQQPQVVYAPQQPPVQIIINDGMRGQQRVCRTIQVWDPSGRFYYGDKRVCHWADRW
jgi:hypothetical protein